MPDGLFSSFCLAAAVLPAALTPETVSGFLTNAVLVLASFFAAVRWRGAALGLVLFVFKDYLPVALDYWVDTFFPLTGEADARRWQMVLLVANGVAAVALLVSVWQMIRMEQDRALLRAGGVAERELPRKRKRRRVG
jgi:hypothetical protein